MNSFDLDDEIQIEISNMLCLQWGGNNTDRYNKLKRKDLTPSSRSYILLKSIIDDTLKHVYNKDDIIGHAEIKDAIQVIYFSLIISYLIMYLIMYLFIFIFLLSQLLMKLV